MAADSIQQQPVQLSVRRMPIVTPSPCARLASASMELVTSWQKIALIPMIAPLTCVMRRPARVRILLIQRVPMVNALLLPIVRVPIWAPQPVRL